MDKLRAVREHLASWLERAKEIRDAVPWAKETLEQVEWQQKVLDDRPADAGAVTEDVIREVDLLHEHVFNSLPALPTIKVSAATFMNSISTSVSSAVYSSVIRAGVVESPVVYQYVKVYTSSYGRLQEQQHRTEITRQRLKRISESLQVQFDRALAAVKSAEALVGERSAAALEVRTLLDNLKGELWVKARKSEQENMTWERMTTTLFDQPEHAMVRREIEHQGRVRSTLLDELSDVAKRRESSKVGDLSALWMRVVDHLYVVAGAITSDAA